MVLSGWGARKSKLDLGLAMQNDIPPSVHPTSSESAILTLNSQPLWKQMWRRGESCSLRRGKEAQGCTEFPSRAAELNRTPLNQLECHLLPLKKERILEI